MDLNEKIIFWAIIFLAFLSACFVLAPQLGEFIILPDFLYQPFKLGLDLSGGIVLVYQADLTQIKQADLKDTLEGLKDLIERRVNLFGVAEPRVTVSNKGRLIVELPQIKDVELAIKLIGETPYLEFRIPRATSEREIILTAQEKGQMLNLDPYFAPSELTGKYLKKAKLEFDPQTLNPYVSLEFDKEGAKIFEKLTEKYLGEKIAIYLDGAPISIPVVKEVITGGRAQITGDFTIESAKKLAQRLNQGALPVPIKLISQTVISPLLGEKFLKIALKGALFGALLVILFMILYYRLAGFVAIFALMIYTVFNLALYKILGVTLTLAGITGFILSVGMAVDANILIFERMREERKKGLEPLGIFMEGFRRAWPSIRDSNFTTILSTLIIYFFSTSFMKGFALTLGMGVLISMLTAVFFTQLLLKRIAGSEIIKSKFFLP